MRATVLGSGVLTATAKDPKPNASEIGPTGTVTALIEMQSASKIQDSVGDTKVNIRLAGLPPTFPSHPVTRSPQLVSSWKVAAAFESPPRHAGGTGPNMRGVFAELVRSKESPSQTTRKFENFGVELSYVNDPDVGNIPLAAVKVMV
jgi:hypothetical protein